MKRSLLSQIFLFFVTLMAGILIAAQIRTYGRARALAREQGNEAILLSELVTANRNLRNEVEALEEQLASYETDGGKTVLEELVNEMNRIKIANGSIEVSGPGIEVVVDGPVTALDLHDLINELRNAGAEAITLNGQRLIAPSVLTVDNTGQLSLDDQTLNRPYRFQAIGDPDTLETALLRSGGTAALLQRTYSGLVLQSSSQSRLVLPVRRSQISFRYAQPVD